MKSIEHDFLETKDSRLIKDYFLSPYEMASEFLINETEKGLQNLGTGPKCLK